MSPAATFLCLLAVSVAQAAGDRSDAGVDADDARTGALLGAFAPAKPEARDRRMGAPPALHGPHGDKRRHRRAEPPAPR